VIVDQDGDLDRDATDAHRNEVRRERIGGPLTREATPSEVPGLSVVLTDGQDGRSWHCASRDQEFAPIADDWRQHLVKHELLAPDLFDRLQMKMRARHARPHMTVTQYFCPGCASCLTSDVLTDRTQPSSPAIND
jgi:hypothetical protein